MKPHIIPILTAFCAALSSIPAPASTISEITSPSGEGLPYHWSVDMSGADTAIFSRHVGAWSWEDNSLFDASIGEPPVGWTHTSDWVALSLAAPTTFALRIERDANVLWPSPLNPNRHASIASMFPSFTMWAHWDTDTDQYHTYNNHGNVDWAEDLSFLAFHDNSTQTFVEESWFLPAGQYSIAIGSNAPANDLNRQGYRATFITTPAPEPGTAAFLFSMIPVLGWRRFRKPVSKVERNPHSRPSLHP